MALVDENHRVSASERILVSSSVTEGVWGPGGRQATVGRQLAALLPLPLPAAFCLRSPVPRGRALLRFLPYAFFWLFSASELGLGGDSHTQSFEGCSFQTGIRQSVLESKCSSCLVLAVGPFSRNAHPSVPAGWSPAASPLPLVSTCCCSPGLSLPPSPTPLIAGHPPHTDPTHSNLVSCSEFLSGKAVVLTDSSS